MSLKTIETTLKEVGRKNDRKALEVFVDSLEDDKMCKLITSKICHSDAPQLLSYLYQGMGQNTSMEVKRFKLTERVLKELQTQKMQNSHMNAIVSGLSLEVEKLTPAHLVQFCEYCIHCIQHDDSEQTVWKDLFPKLLRVLITSDSVNHSGVDMTGSDYKSEVIRTLLVIKWQPSVVTSLGAMFTKISLSTEQHLQIVNKLCASFEELGPSELPPLVHHLLQLCKNENSVVLFLRLQTYFSVRLYNNLLSDNTESEKSDMDIGLASDRETQFAEATILFHIHQSATFEPTSIESFLKFMKSVINAPDLALDPFLLTVLLSVSSIYIYEEQVFDILKCAVQRAVQEREKRLESAWLYDVTPDDCNVELVLTKIMENSLQERSSVMEGLVNLAFILLGATSAKGKESITEKVWEYGAFILVKLIKKHHEVRRTVLQLLTDRIITGHAVTQYTDCLYQLALSVPLVLNEYRSIIISLLEKLEKLPGPVAEDVVCAMLPIVRPFPALRDVLIMVLRKALFSRDIETRKMAVSGFLKLLKHLDVKGLAVLSSQSSSQHSSEQIHSASLLTQIDMEFGNSTSNNEAICLELLGVLRRCFMQQADVRLRLYEGLCSGVNRNPELSEFVQDILINHFNQFYICDEDTLPPLDFSKAVNLKDDTVELQEPLGHLVFALQQVATSAPSDSNPNKLIRILDSLVGRMIKCSLEDFCLNDDTNFLDNSTESQQQQEMVRQMLGVFEALMGYIISSWTVETSIEKSQKLNSLFKGYSRLVEFAKNSGKSGKKVDGDGATQQRRMNNGNKTAGKGRSATFRFPHTVLDYHVTSRMLSLFHKNSVSWCTAEAANQVKGRREFNKYATDVALKLVKASRARRKSILKSTSIIKLYNKISSLLYSHCVARLQEFREFDLGTAALSLECFNELFDLISSHHKEKLGHFLEVVDVPLRNGLSEQLLALASKYEELLTDILLGEEEAEDEPGAKRIPKLLIQGLTQTALQIPCADTRSKVLTWVKTFAREKELPDVNLVKGMVTLLFGLEMSCKASSQLYDHIAMKLCELVGIIEDGEEVAGKYTSYSILKVGYDGPVLVILCDTVKQMLEHVDWVLCRLRAEYAAMTQSVSNSREQRKEFIKSKEQEVVQQMSHCIQILNYVCSLVLDPGPICDSVLKLLTHQYTSLTVLTKYFIVGTNKTAPSFQVARFDRVVKLAGKFLSSHIFNLISHIEANQKEKDNKKRKLDSQLKKMKVLKETRLIPKLVFEMEQFEKFIIELSKRSKVNLTSYMKLSTYRDFRIQSNLMQAAIDLNESTNDTANDSADIEESDKNESSIKEPPKKRARKE